MKLPEIDAYAFPVTIPSTGKDIKMRPYLVREEKLLLMAQENDSYKEQTDAVAQVIENCTDNAIDAKTSPYFDIEYLMLQLRARSIGDVATPVYVCNNEIAPGVKCENNTTLRLSINDVKVSNLEESKKLLNIELNNNLILTLKYPNIYDVTNMFEVVQATGKKSVALDEMVHLFGTLTDKKNKVTYNFSDYSKEDKVEFLESLNPSVLDKLLVFFETMPKIEHDIEYECSKCKFQHNVHLSGLRSFLEFWENTIPSPITTKPLSS